MSEHKSPSAFPVPYPNHGSGMTLRDYFAAAAMQGWITGVDSPDIKACVKAAYHIADAMLKERSE